MRKVSWRMKSCCYPSWNRSNSAPAHYTLFGMVNVFRSCVLAELSVLLAIRIVPFVVTSTAPRQTRSPAAEIISFSALYTFMAQYFFILHWAETFWWRQESNSQQRKFRVIYSFWRKNFSIPGKWSVFFSPRSSGRLWGHTQSYGVPYRG